MTPLYYGKQSISKRDIKIVVKTLKSSHLTTGRMVEIFEKKIAKKAGAKYCVAVANGTAGLHIASLCILDKNDIVLTTPNSFLATSNAILYAKAKPLFVDILPNGMIDLDICEQHLKKDMAEKTRKIKAIYIVSFSGLLVDYKKLKYLKQKYNIKILLDNAHTMGAKIKNCDIAIFSFHPVKHITTGEGGAVVTNSDKIYKNLLSLRNHGQDNNHNMLQLGYNYRLSDIACALGVSQLKRLDFFIHKRQKIAKQYDKAFTNTTVKPLYDYTKNSYYHIYIVLIDFEKIGISKEQFLKQLSNKNIYLQIHYKPIDKQPYYKKLGYCNHGTPCMDSYIKQSITLPCYVDLKQGEQKRVIKEVLRLIAK